MIIEPNLIILSIIILLFSLYIIHLVKLSEILFASRQFLLAAPGLLAFANKSLDPQSLFAKHMSFSQSSEMATKMMFLSMLAVLGSHIGYKWISKRIISSFPVPLVSIITPKFAYVLYYGGIAGSLAAGTYFAINVRPVWELTYGSNVVGEVLFGNLNSMIGVFFGAALIGFLTIKNNQKQNHSPLILIVAAVYVLGWCYLARGYRQDVISTLFLCYLVFYMSLSKLPRVRAKVILVGILVVILGQAWGLLRGGMGELSSFTWDEVVGYMLENDPGRDVLISGGTLNDVSATFSGTVFFVDNGSLELELGLGYLRFILRSVPNFLWSERPRDEAWIFTEDFAATSGGGFYELAQAYLNFGVLGCFFVPLIITIFIFYFYRKATYNPSLIAIFSILGILSAWLRGSLYQTFAFWRGWNTGLFILLIFFIINRFTNLNKRN
jgi:hypothetical protein